MSARLKRLPSTTSTSAVATYDQTSLNQRIEVLSALAEGLLAEIDRIHSTIIPGHNEQNSPGMATRAARASPGSGSINFYKEIERFETELIKTALRQTSGSQRRAAALLQMNPTTLNAKIKHLGIYVLELISEHLKEVDGGDSPAKKSTACGGRLPESASGRRRKGQPAKRKRPS